MSLSEKIREKPVVWLGVPLAVVLLVAVAWVMLSGGGNDRSEVLVYWYDPASADLLAAPATAPPGDAYVRAHMFYCGDTPDDLFPAVLSRDVDGASQVSGVDVVRWVNALGPQAEQIYEALNERCEGKGAPRQWYPTDDEG